MLVLQQFQTTRPGIASKISQNYTKTCFMASAISYPRRAVKYAKRVQRQHMRVVVASSEQEGKYLDTNVLSLSIINHVLSSPNNLLSH